MTRRPRTRRPSFSDTRRIPLFEQAPMPMAALQSGTPRHEQVAAWLRDQITACTLAPDAQLPSEHALCERFGVSRVTVRHALATLESEGLIYRRQGLGSFVRRPRVPTGLVRLTSFAEDAARAGFEASSEVRHLGTEPATEALAQKLGVAEGLPLTRLDRVRLADGLPVAFDQTWMPPRIGALLDEQDLEHDTLYHLLEARFRIPVLGGTLRFDATDAPALVADALGLAPGTAVMRVSRTSLTTGEEPVFFQCRHYRGDRVAFDLTLARDADRPRGEYPMQELDAIFLPAP